MKNKKLIILMSIILVISILSIAMVGCKQSFSLSKAFDNDLRQKPFASEVKQLSAISGWQYDDGCSSFLWLNKYDETGLPSSKMLYSLASDKVLVTVTADVSALDVDFYMDTLAIVKDTANNRMDIYDADGLVLSADSTVFSTNNTGSTSQLFIGNGKTITIDLEDYSVKVSDTTLVEPQPELEKFGDYYIETSSSFVLKVYDKNKKYMHTVSFSEFMTSVYMPLSTAVNNDGLIVLQFLKVLSDDAKDYDIIDGGNKYKMVTVAKSLKTGKDANVKLESGIIYSIIPQDGYNYLVGSKYRLSATGERILVQAGFFDDDFNCIFDTTSYGLSERLAENLPAPLPNGDFIIAADDLSVIIDANGQLKNIFDTSNLSVVGIDASGIPVYQLKGANLVNGANQLYDVSGNLICTLSDTATVMPINIPSSFIYYSDDEITTDENGLQTTTKSYYAYDMNTSTAKKIGKVADVSFTDGNTVYVISERGEDNSIVSKSAYSTIDGKQIYSDIDVSTTVNSYMLDSMSSMAILFEFKDADGNYSYSIYTVKQAA